MAEINLKNSSSFLTREDIGIIEKELKIIIPKEMQDFYLKFNGGIPNRKYFFVPQYVDNLKIRFFKFFKFENSKSLTIEESYNNGIKRGFLYQNLIPFANDDGGNYFCINNEGKTFYYAIDAWTDSLTNEENIKENLILLANSFNEFIDKLTSKPTYK